MKIIFKILFLNLFILKLKSYEYTLPGNQKWPTDKQFQQFQNSTLGNVTLRGQENYKPTTYNLRTNNPKPAAIVYVENSEDIKKSIQFAKKHDLRISVWSTGHHQDIRNTADNSIQINLKNMKRKSVNLDDLTVTVETGNIFSEIDDFVANKTNKEYVCLSGADPSVGPYGWAVGGGHGRLTRMYGLGADAIKSIDLILVNGTQITASEEQNQDLFRALRGSGGSAYGIATNITFNLYHNPGKVSRFTGIYEANDQTAQQYTNWLINAPNNVGAYYLLSNYPSPYVLVSAFCFGNTGSCDLEFEDLQPNCISDQGACTTSYFEDYYDFQEQLTPDTGEKSSLYLVSTALDSDNAYQALKEANQFISDNSVYEISIAGCSANSVLGGESQNLDPNGDITSVAPAMRQSIIAISCYVVWGAGEDQEDVDIQKYLIQKIEQFSQDTLMTYGTDKWTYWNEPNHQNDENSEWQQRYWGSQNNNYQQLLEVKQKYDPDNFLTCYQCIGWDQKIKTDPEICPSQTCSCSNTSNGECSNNPDINLYIESQDNEQNSSYSLNQQKQIILLAILLLLYFN